jgi:hypothetical protein
MRRWMSMGALACVALAAAACSSSNPHVATAVSSGAATTTSSSRPGSSDDVSTYLDGMRTWVKCVRDKGIDVSDPDPLGQVTFPGDPAAQKADPKFEQAQQQCASVRPPVPDSVLEQRKPKLTPEQVETNRKYAQCMQGNGAADFPDPGPDGYPPRDTKWNQTSAGAQKASRTCAPIIGDPATPATTQG